MSKKELKGSKLHMQDLVKRPGLWHLFEKELSVDRLEVTKLTCPRPSASNPKEVSVPTFLKDCWPDALNMTGDLVTGWWLKEGSRTPQWDLLCLGQVNRKPGIVMVEAKAHVAELKEKDHCTSTSKDNRSTIAAAIVGAAKALCLPEPSEAKSLTTHYQLRNRIAWAYKLASSGIPVVLVYLGFTDDPCWSRDPIKLETWREKVIDPKHRVLRDSFDRRPHSCGVGTLWFRTVKLPIADVCSYRGRKESST